MGKINEIAQNLKQSFDCNDIEVNILDDKVVIDSTKKVIEINNTLRATNIEINGVSSVPFTSAEKEKLNKFSTPMQVVGRVDSVELLPLTDVSIGSVYLVGLEGSSDFEEYIVIGLEPTAYERLGKTQTHQVQVDWAETDESAVDYIASKPAIKAGQGVNSIVEGDLVGNSSTGKYSHAEGQNTTASAWPSHAEGYYTTASGEDSHAEGYYTTASGINSHAEGTGTIANHKSQHVFGEHNIADPSLNITIARGNYVEIVGNGSNSTARSNARTLDWAGNEVLSGTLTANGINLSEAISTVKLRVSGSTLQASIDGGTTWHTINFAD